MKVNIQHAHDVRTVLCCFDHPIPDSNWMTGLRSRSLGYQDQGLKPHLTRTHEPEHLLRSYLGSLSTTVKPKKPESFTRRYRMRHRSISSRRIRPLPRAAWCGRTATPYMALLTWLPLVEILCTLPPFPRHETRRQDTSPRRCSMRCRA
jgi:hypothetical protein